MSGLNDQPARTYRPSGTISAAEEYTPVTPPVEERLRKVEEALAFLLEGQDKIKRMLADYIASRTAGPVADFDDYSARPLR
jgi:hypothetical protein